jgi:hypothetical protein
MSLRLGEASRRAADALMQQGLTLSPKPEIEMPILPSDVTVLDDEDLMILYSLLTAWADFISTQVSCAQVDERAAEKRLSHAENLLMIASGDKGDRVTYARAQVAADNKIVAMKEEVEEAHAYRKLIESMASNIERDAALVSRELTRRTSSRNRTSPSRWSA